MFKETLQGVVDGTRGGIAGLLMDFEGIPLESYARVGDFDIEAVGAEASVIIKSIQRATEMLEAGETREVSFQSERMSTLICIGFDPKSPAFTGCLGILSDYEVTMSKVEREEATVLLIQLTKDGVGLEAPKLRRVLRELRETLTSCVLRD